MAKESGDRFVELTEPERGSARIGVDRRDPSVLYMLFGTIESYRLGKVYGKKGKMASDTNVKKVAKECQSILTLAYDTPPEIRGTTASQLADFVRSVTALDMEAA